MLLLVSAMGDHPQVVLLLPGKESVANRGRRANALEATTALAEKATPKKRQPNQAADLQKAKVKVDHILQRELEELLFLANPVRLPA